MSRETSATERLESKTKKGDGNASTSSSARTPLPSTTTTTTTTVANPLPTVANPSSPLGMSSTVTAVANVTPANKHTVSGLVNECDLTEMNECLACHPKLADVFKSSDDLIHALKVISSIKPNEKFSTNSGIYIQTEIQHPTTWMEMVQHYLHPVWLIRMKNGDDRITNLKAIKAIFVGALLVVEESLQEREQVIKPKDPVSRTDVVKKLKNEQVINRMAEAITKAVSSMENLKQTYTGDAHACARIDMLTETIRDRLALIKTSLDFLK